MGASEAGGSRVGSEFDQTPEKVPEGVVSPFCSDGNSPRTMGPLTPADWLWKWVPLMGAPSRPWYVILKVNAVWAALSVPTSEPLAEEVDSGPGSCAPENVLRKRVCACAADRS